MSSMSSLIVPSQISRACMSGPPGEVRYSRALAWDGGTIGIEARWIPRGTRKTYFPSPSGSMSTDHSCSSTNPQSVCRRPPFVLPLVS